MKFYQEWQGLMVENGNYSEAFNVSVPGNIQKDYGEYMGWPDFNVMDNCRKYETIEDCFWSYKTNIEYAKEENKRVFFVSHGIEYEYDIKLNGKLLLHHEGMYTKLELDITDELKFGNSLEVLIYPHPKLPDTAIDSKQAAQSVKPSVCYGYDWHPRIIVSGIWDETYIETRGEDYIRDAEAFYTLNNNLTAADIHFEVDCNTDTKIEIFDNSGNVVYSGTEKDIHLDNINLWWCRGQGEPYLYSYIVSSPENSLSGKIGFRQVELIMNENAWIDTRTPKSRAPVPITILLNNRRIFAKGSNFVPPEVFTANTKKETFKTLLTYAKEANMNILRAWGGAVINKDFFFEICDELGLMVWQDFPLSCNNHKGTKKYLTVLEEQARVIIKRIRRHACHVIWCGGNELFNFWSGMTDQSHAIRLLNKICYEDDYHKPFLATTPLYGMGHGFYQFYDEVLKKNVYQLFNDEKKTAYVEFATPSFASMEQLKRIFDEETLNNPVDSDNSPWNLHHVFKAWRRNSWGCFDILDMVFGKQDNIESYVEKSNLLQCQSLKFIFEEARRDKGECSMALNWDYNDSWCSAAGNNLIEHPTTRKPVYYAVQSSLKDVVPSIKPNAFSYKSGEEFNVELWLLNDSPEAVQTNVEVYLTIDGKTTLVEAWNNIEAEPNKNVKGENVSFVLPQTENQVITITLKSDLGENEYKFLLKN